MISELCNLIFPNTEIWATIANDSSMDAESQSAAERGQSVPCTSVACNQNERLAKREYFLFESTVTH
jgi:hypothetical protein